MSCSIFLLNAIDTLFLGFYPCKIHFSYEISKRKLHFSIILDLQKLHFSVILNRSVEFSSK